MHDLVHSRSSSRPSFTPVRRGLLQRKCACGGTPGPSGECEACRKKRLQRKSNQPSSSNSHQSEVPPIVHEVLRSPGQPLDRETRAFMEPRFGHDFSNIRVHSDARAAESARAINAHAYTMNQDIVFGTGRYEPERAAGMELLAHELAHSVQQHRATGMPALKKIALGAPDSVEEREATLAGQVLGMRAASRAATAPCVQRKTWDDLPVYEERPEIKAGPGKWEIHQTNTNGSATTAYSSSVSIKFHPNPAKVNCDEVSFVQNVRTIDPATKIANEPRANFQNRMTGTGWTIDRVDKRQYGWYGYNNDGKPSGLVTPGKSPTPLTSAEMTDGPNWNVPNLIWDFEACAICKAGREVNQVYGCLTWGFDADASFKVTSHPTEELSAPSAEFAEAIKKWNKQATGAESKRNDPNQKPLGPFK